ncbi:rho guanine nucleotide exchange factor 15 isoform X2 [Puntigrus tetrazona]|uniref:rho guanine nucleotide exchange factor 15 isoform X2 n=1 Tax=Puntigrus tetrazona TaxID=1606681 RepID=UPI001C8917AB|nr:rho guanine nucleotide exchange factor 15 isoform X2 [Puntigrus tetrazona]XP_043097219.1 rho guanine nucleotide exchange factor 15 isoform X2 [Puntigrus tetrazona]
MPGPDGCRELYPCQNFPVSKTYSPPEPPLKGEKWRRATDFILRRDVQEKDHQRQNSTVAQKPHQGVATHSLVALPKIKPIPKPCLPKMLFHVDQSQPVHNGNINYVTSASDPACSDGKSNDTHLENWRSRPKTISQKSKRVPPSIPVPARPLPKEPEQMISMMGSEVCPPGKALPHLSLSKPIPSFRVHDKPKLKHNKVELISDFVREGLVSELHKRFSGAIKERDCSTNKPKVFICFHTKRLTDGERLHENVSISGVSNGDSPEDVPSVIKCQETDGENNSKNLLETSQRALTMLPLPGLVDKLIKSPSQRDFNCMCADNKRKLVESLWQERRVVRDSGILHRLSKEQLKLQEHLYEVVTSEQSYLQGLEVAVEHFQESSVLKDALAPRDRKSLFSSIAKIKEISQSFMDAMLLELASSVFCDIICDVVHQYALGPFDAYINYIRNMPYQEQTLHNLGKESPRIVEILHKLQEDPRCSRLPLKSFLSLPFQRITRLKILMENIQKKALPGSDCEASSLRALTEISRLLEACNWQVGRMKQMEEIVQIANKIEFACKALPLVSSSRWLVKQGDLVQISLKENMFGQRKLCPVLLFLFNDLLLVATRKGLDRFVVHDYVHRSLIEVTEGKDLEEELEGYELNRTFRLVLLHNHRSTTSQHLLQTNSERLHVFLELRRTCGWSS